MTHDQYAGSVRELNAKMREAIGKIETLQLTKQERAVIDALPKDKIRIMESVLSRYQSTPVDMRREMVLKGIALLIINARLLADGWKLGTKAANEMEW
jgi:hypothetical protein